LTQEKIKNVVLIKAQMDVDRAIANKNVSTINGEAKYESITFANQITANMIKNTVETQANAYAETKKALKFDTSSNLLDYIFYLNVMNLNQQDAKLMVGMDNARVTLRESGKGYDYSA
jgi:hypothetical protein